MRLYLIRHAHTQQDRQMDAAHWQLSEQGARQAQALAHLPFWDDVTHIIVSSEAKTRLTVEPVLVQRQLPLLVDPRFDELHRGHGWSSTDAYQGHVQRTFAQPDQAVNGWEPAAQAQQRVITGVAALIERFSTTTVALVGHGLTISLYRAYLLGQPTVQFTDWQQLRFAAVALVDPVAGRLLQDFTAVEWQESVDQSVSKSVGFHWRTGLLMH